MKSHSASVIIASVSSSWLRRKMAHCLGLGSTLLYGVGCRLRSRMLKRTDLALKGRPTPRFCHGLQRALLLGPGKRLANREKNLFAPARVLCADDAGIARPRAELAGC